MSYSDRDSSNYGAMGGIGGFILLVLLVGLRVGLKAAARSARNYNYSESQYDNTPQYANLPETNRAGSQISSPTTSPEPVISPEQQQADAQAAYNARVQQEAAQREADRLQREQAEAAQRAQAQQQEADERARRERELADQQAREEALRQQQANANNPPAAVEPPAAVPAPGQPAAPEAPQAGAANQAPGFAVTDISQVKPRDNVFVSVNGQWLPALVQAKRGQLVQVRDKATGNVEAVELNRIRLEKEPIVKANANVPNALRAVGAGPKAIAKADDDDSLFVAKPKKDDDRPAAELSAPAVAAAKPGGPANAGAAAGEFRTWTDGTGTFKVEASLVSFEFGQVQLRKRDGKVVSLSLEKLSAADQAVIRDRFK